MVKRLICSFLAVSLSISLCACGNREVGPENVTISFEDSEPVSVVTASEMKLVETAGAVNVTDGNSTEQPVLENMNLYSGYRIGTEAVSYAWIDLDETKLLKMDQNSHAEFEKNGRKLKVILDAGSMFFCVLEDLEEDEALEFETPNATNMAMAVRGTVGIVKVVSDTESQVVLLEGSVSLENGNGSSIYLQAGEVGGFAIDENGQTSEIKRSMTNDDVPTFVMDMMQGNEAIQNKILTTRKGQDYLLVAEQFDLYKDLIQCYQAALAGHKPENGSPYWDDLCKVYEHRGSENASSHY